MGLTKISWTEYTWNPLKGCTHAGTPECDHCYARSMAKRLQAMHKKGYANGFDLTLLPEKLEEVKTIPRYSRVFLPSMSDLFHEKVPDEYIEKVMDACVSRPDLTFQVLSKRAERMAEFFKTHEVPQNVWLGVTIGHAMSVYRLAYLKQINAPVRFISAEPLLGDIAPLMDLTGIDWVIVGGESGVDARPMQEEWALNLKRVCEEAECAFFFKQWGAWGADGVHRNKKSNGKLLSGMEYKAYPIPRAMKCYSVSEIVSGRN